MGFLKSDSPSIDYPVWQQGSRSERIKPLVRHIAERGMGNPAATGEFERGTCDIADLVVRQPWQDDVPISVVVSAR